MISIPLSQEVEARLRARAAAAGQDIATYAAKVLERLSQPPISLREVSGALGEEFRRSGMTDEQLGELLEETKQGARRRREARP